MKFKILLSLLVCSTFFKGIAYSKDYLPKISIPDHFLTSDSSKRRLPAQPGEANLLPDAPVFKALNQQPLLGFNRKGINSDSIVFKPTVHFGALLQMSAGLTQDGYPNPLVATPPTAYSKSFNINRLRLLFGGQLSRKGTFFIETELASTIGVPNADGSKNVKVSPIILDAQFKYDFSNAFQLIAGEQLVSASRNGLQTAGALLTSSYGTFQFPYNILSTSPLEGNFGRDLGVNARGFIFNNKFEYRLGVFTGRNTDGKGPLRLTGRFAYNFLDADKDYYYVGTKLGKGKTFTLGAGFDTQGSYSSLSTDLFVDAPVTDAGSVTLNGAFQYMTGGTDVSKYSFATLIPAQSIQFLELGYYFKKAKIQPWIKLENQAISAHYGQTKLVDPSRFDKLNSSKIYSYGVNYLFNGMGSNLRFSYNSRAYNVVSPMATYNTQTYGQFLLQLQMFFY